MTSVTVVIGGHTVSNDVIDVDIWMNKKTSIGVCELLIDNTADQWGDDFEPNDAIAISINAVLMFSGTVDNVVPYLDKKGVLSNYITVKGRDGGRYLSDLYYTENFVSTRSGAIIDTILAGVGDPLLYTNPGGTPFIKYDSQRTKLIDSFKDICDLSAWDMYIDTTGRIQFFASGTVASGVALKSVGAAADNNLLSFEEYEEIGYDIKNLIEVHAGSVKDHWTDGNAAQWTDLLAGGTTFSDETTVYIYGAESIKVVAADNDETFGLDFTTGGGDLYSQGGSIDMSKFAQNKVVFRHDDASVGNFQFKPYLKDGSGNEIVFTRNSSGQGKDGYTNNITTTVDKWRSLAYQTGEHVSNEVVATPQSGRWSGDVGFDWGDVEDIGFNLVTTDDMDTIYIDAWYMPAIEAKSIVTDAASVAAYDTRMYSEYRKDLKSQTALDAESAKILAYRKDPLRKFKATTSGQTGTKYAAQTVTVQAPDYGIAGATAYIIIALHHILHNNANTRGYDYLTKYELALSAVDSTRVINDDDPMQALLLKLARENRGFKGSQTDDEAWLGDIMTGYTPQITTGATFPTDMNIGDEFFLTADLTVGASEYYGPALYRYDGDAADWLRDPIVMHRAADPPAGGEVIYDTLHRTDLDRWYRWTGVWTLIDFDAGTISGTLSSSQLKKGIQKFDSAVFFYPIRTNASDTVTFDIDVNNGAGGADIDASAGTPFDVFTAGDELIIQGCEDEDTDSILHVIDTVNGGGTGITLTAVLNGTDNADDETCIVTARDAVRWVGANPAVWFADGTNQQVVTGDVNGLALGSHWIYFSTADTDAHTTNTYANAVGDTVGIICRLEITADAEPLIMPVYSRGGNMTLDFLGAGAVDTIVLTADAIIGKDFRTAAGVGVGTSGVKFDKSGISGWNGANKTSEIAVDTGYFIAYGNVAGGSFRLNVGADNYGWITSFLDGADEVTEFRGDDQIWLNVGGDLVVLNASGNIVFDEDFDALIPATDGNVDIGTNVIRWGNIYGDDIYGTVRYSDMRSTDLTCVRCGERFRAGDDLMFEVKGYEPNLVHGEEMLSLPVHKHCTIAKLRKMFSEVCSWF